MASVRSMRRGSVRTAVRRDVRMQAYVDGTAVRKLNQNSQTAVRRPSERPDTAGNRERALRMNMGYVLFLTAMAVITVLICVNYLKLQAKSTKLRNQVTSIQSSLDELRLENDLDYDRVISGIDMEHVKDVAMNELGMVYISKKQIIPYSQQDSDYVRQYEKIS